MDLCGGPATCTLVGKGVFHGMDQESGNGSWKDSKQRARTPAALVSAIKAAGPFVSLLGLFGSNARGTGAKGGTKKSTYLTTRGLREGNEIEPRKACTRLVPSVLNVADRAMNVGPPLLGGEFGWLLAPEIQLDGRWLEMADG